MLCFAKLCYASPSFALLCFALLCYAFIYFALLCFAMLDLCCLHIFFYTRFWTFFLAFLKAPGTFSICPGTPAGEGSLRNQGRKNSGNSH